MTIRFQAEVSKGMIPIPEEFWEEFHDKSEVEVELKTRKTNGDEPFDIISELIKNPIKISDFTPFTRDEIYDRRL